MRSWWRVIRRIWITTGIAATVIFMLWTAIAIRATATARAALASDASVTVVERDHGWAFRPASRASEVGLLFFSGALVDPVAYAPLLHQVAATGRFALLVRLPRRGAFGGADGSEVLTHGVDATLAEPAIRRWVVAGHSRGGEVACRLAFTRARSLAGLVLIGTSHPRDLNLASLSIPVTRVFGTRDTVADLDKVERVRVNLPPQTRDVRIDGGNHSQFGYYGFQPGDWPATIGREEQQSITLRALLDTIETAERRQD